MPSTTEKQKRFFGAVMGAKKGHGGIGGKARDVAKHMSESKIKDYLKVGATIQKQSIAIPGSAAMGAAGAKVLDLLKRIPSMASRGARGFGKGLGAGGRNSIAMAKDIFSATPASSFVPEDIDKIIAGTGRAGKWGGRIGEAAIPAAGISGGIRGTRKLMEKAQEAYAFGFMDKCAYLGVDPEQLLKESQTAMLGTGNAMKKQMPGLPLPGKTPGMNSLSTGVGRTAGGNALTQGAPMPGV